MDSGKQLPTRTFEKKQRLRKRSDFKRLLRRPGFRREVNNILLRAVNGRQQSARLGIVISRKVIDRAVKRNLFKRLVRESFRTRRQHIAGMDILIQALPGLNKDTLRSQLNPALDRLWEELATWKNPLHR